MPWETMEFSDGAWEVNREGVMRIMRSRAWSQAVVENSFISRETHVFGPDLNLVDTDWANVRKDTNDAAKSFYEDFFSRLENGEGGAAALQRLGDIVDEKDSFEETFDRMRHDAHTLLNIQTSVQLGEDVLPVLENIRDLSIDSFMIGAGVLSGGP